MSVTVRQIQAWRMGDNLRLVHVLVATAAFAL